MARVPGHRALSSIDEALADIRRQERGVNESLEAINQKVAELQTAEAEVYRDLARFRMEEDPEGLAERLDGTGRRVAKILIDRRQMQDARRSRIDALEEESAELRRARDDRADDLVLAAERHQEAENRLRDQLRRDPDWQAQNALFDKARHVAEEARKKTEVAEKDRKVKGAPYEADSLFMYLWKRGYGTSAYKAGRLARMGDRWVARLIDYQHARPNYAMLIDIPKRLDEHADRAEALVTAEREKLAALERAAFDDAPARETAAAVARLREAIAEIDQRKAAADQELADLTEADDRAANGQDTAWRDAQELLAESLKNDTLRQLYRHARSTPSPEDERLVDRIEDIVRSLDRLERDATAERDYLRELAARRGELTQITRDFRNRGWDNAGSSFGGAVAGALLAEFLRGAISGSQYWDRMERGHTWNRGPRHDDFGSGFDFGNDWGGGGNMGGGDFWTGGEF